MKTKSIVEATIKTKSIIESISEPDWSIKGWKIHFLFSERQLHQAKKLSVIDKWYEDPIVIATCHDRLRTCFNSIREFHNTFGSLPQIGDRLFDEDSGLLVQERSIDGDLMIISYMLSI